MGLDNYHKLRADQMVINLAEPRQTSIKTKDLKTTRIICLDLDAVRVGNRLAPESMELIEDASSKNIQVILAGEKRNFRGLRGLDNFRVTFVEKPTKEMAGEELKNFLSHRLTRAGGGPSDAGSLVSRTNLVKRQVHPDYLKPVLSEEDYAVFYKHARNASGEVQASPLAVRKKASTSGVRLQLSTPSGKFVITGKKGKAGVILIMPDGSTRPAPSQEAAIQMIKQLQGHTAANRPKGAINRSKEVATVDYAES